MNDESGDNIWIIRSDGSETRQFAAGDPIIEEGEQARAFYVLESGRVP